jgi:hypothetical protein
VQIGVVVQYRSILSIGAVVPGNQCFQNLFKFQLCLPHWFVLASSGALYQNWGLTHTHTHAHTNTDTNTNTCWRFRKFLLFSSKVLFRLESTYIDRSLADGHTLSRRGTSPKMTFPSTWSRLLHMHEDELAPLKPFTCFPVAVGCLCR